VISTRLIEHPFRQKKWTISQPILSSWAFHPSGVEQGAMSDLEKATRVLDALKAAEDQPAQLALPTLNGLVGLVQGSGEQPLEVEEARSGAFMAICEVGKALHRGQPADRLWSAAIGATERWMSLAK
jgi:hypothetical protein